MSYSGESRSARGRIAAAKPRTRIIAVAATLAVFGGIVAVTQVSNAGTRGQRPRGAVCATPGAPGATESPAPTVAPGTPRPGASAGTYAGERAGVRHHIGDGQEPANAETLARRGRGQGNCTPAPGSGNPGSTTSPGTGSGNPGTGNPGGGLEILGNNCEGSQRQAHDGFQNGDRCVSTQFGEVGNADKNPTLLISSAPQRVRVNQAFTIRVSTRNLVRDRFLAAGQGGYYKESSFLDANGLVRGHFHSACRMLDSTRTAPDPAPVPAFFVATEDGRGSAQPDEVAVQIAGLPATGQAQCAVWAGDGSHRVPMMQRANQIPAFDVVRVTVTR